MKRDKLICACAALILLTALCCGALAKVPSPSKEFYFLDQANVLSEATEGEIFFSNQLLEKECGAQIVVVTVKTTGSEATDDYAYELFNEWGIGDKQAQNGFLLLLSISDDDYYALAGSNLQPKFTSATIKDYYDDYLEADFAAKRYDAGVKKFFEAAFARIADTYNADVTVQDGIAAYNAWLAQGDATEPMRAGSGGARAARGDDDGGIGMIVMVLVIIALIAVLGGVRRRRRRVGIHPVIINTINDPVPPPPLGGPQAGPGGYRGVPGQSGFDNMPGAGGYRGPDTFGNMPGAGGYRGTPQRPHRTSDGGAGWIMSGIMNGLFRSSGGSSRSSGSSRSFGSSSRSSRSSGGSRSFGSSHGGGGGSRGGGAGRGRH